MIIGPGRSNGIRGRSELGLPACDRNIIVTIHYYQPFASTHQGAPWAGRQDQVGVRWPAPQPRSKRSAATSISHAGGHEHNRPLFLGEFGAYDAGDIADRAAWTDFVAREAERRGWSWSYWQFDGDFIAYDIPAETWVLPIRDALLPPPSQPPGNETGGAGA